MTSRLDLILEVTGMKRDDADRPRKIFSVRTTSRRMRVLVYCSWACLVVALVVAAKVWLG